MLGGKRPLHVPWSRHDNTPSFPLMPDPLNFNKIWKNTVDLLSQQKTGVNLRTEKTHHMKIID